MNRHLFLTVLEAGSQRSGCWHGWGLVGALFLVSRWPPSRLCPHVGEGGERGGWERQRKLSHVFSRAGTNPIMRLHAHDLVTSQRPHVLILEARVSHTNLGGRSLCTAHSLRQCEQLLEDVVVPVISVTSGPGVEILIQTLRYM